MKRLLALGALLASASCYSPRDWDPEEARDHVPYTEPVTVEHRIESPPGPGLQYMVLQVEDQRALTPWLDSREAAESAGREWEQKRPGLGWYVLWRQKP